jgi:hypothetical protein
MLGIKRADRQRRFHQWLPIHGRCRFADGDAGASLKSEQANETNEQDRD